MINLVCYGTQEKNEVEMKRVVNLFKSAGISCDSFCVCGIGKVISKKYNITWYTNMTKGGNNMRNMKADEAFGYTRTCRNMITSKKNLPDFDNIIDYIENELKLKGVK